ncbi:hypothetical protein U1Q18_003023, partial [Sarracenia purpurea var. burkii]
QVPASHTPATSVAAPFVAQVLTPMAPIPLAAHVQPPAAPIPAASPPATQAVTNSAPAAEAHCFASSAQKRPSIQQEASSETD